jgi:adhesin transport system membrane fusion protein
MEVIGYPSEKYGKLEGNIAEISSDSTIDAEGNVWFMVKVIIEDATLHGKTEHVRVVNGMIVSVSIIYSESTWLDWILRGFGFQ